MAARSSNTWFFHGTTALAASCIAVDGFRLLDEGLRHWGEGGLGSGIYLTRAPTTAGFFSGDPGFALRVRLAAGTRMLRLTGEFDQRVIDSLRREFGAEILAADFDKAIPRNKRLRPGELIHLFNYLWSKDLVRVFSDEHRAMRRYLAASQYHGLGESATDTGIVIFNPSRLVLDSIWVWSQGKLSPPDFRRLIAKAVDTVSSLTRTATKPFVNATNDYERLHNEEVKLLRREVPRWARCVVRHAEQLKLPIDEQVVREALALAALR
ncbi:MAG: hypothetical protein SFU86_10295 [Pirellulaceae bacterium]|nr:hypothetical protein [Pirellulaceae bacterium]